MLDLRNPLDTLLLDNIFNNHEFVITIEEGSIGGFSSALLHYVHNIKKTRTISAIKNIIFPDRFVEHNTSENQYKEIGMDSDSIAEKILFLISSKVIPINTYKNK